MSGGSIWREAKSVDLSITLSKVKRGDWGNEGDTTDREWLVGLQLLKGMVGRLQLMGEWLGGLQLMREWLEDYS